MNLDQYLRSYEKLKWITYLSVKTKFKTLKLEENIGKNVHHLEVAKNVIGKIQKALIV